MTNKQEKLRKDINDIADKCLSLDAAEVIDRKIYDEKDLGNALLIFNHVVWNLWAAYCLEEFWLEKWVILSEEFGKNLRQSILLYTGIDTQDIYK